MGSELRLKHESDRIALVGKRDGKDAAIEWVQRTMRIYRRAILDHRHFASTGEYRLRFIESYCDFKRWLAALERRSE